ncbi:hypothetical protein [Chitinophaga ginsengisegetis]|uniref:hypothetical protein n=1 Tax=Chitinophaga ginsengisegetis TaxID=393003 RepID=UPI000DE9669A|nr:hypothetical protein [Chitinophaga ginsengisegetis]MDR6568594.1 hypothetical protein [Chitinophaga ginsengisegetis]MDR6648175.1 hypothetical protein [Chitinophaga ginsengisegetis]MDR6654675.1 hypothetical protein [Chitinophaga ginsengisegetis]
MIKILIKTGGFFIVTLLFASCFSKEWRLRKQKETWNTRVKEYHEKDSLNKLAQSRDSVIMHN